MVTIRYAKKLKELMLRKLFLSALVGVIAASVIPVRCPQIGP